MRAQEDDSEGLLSEANAAYILAAEHESSLIMSSVSITSAAPRDLSTIAALLEEADLPRVDLSPSDLSHFRVLRSEEDLQGVVGLEPVGREALLRSLVVQPEVRGQGYGRALVRDAEAYARRQDIEALYLLTTTAAEFFATLGYERVSRGDVPRTIAQTAEFRELCPATAVCMHASLVDEDV